MNRGIERALAIGLTALLSTCLLPDAVWRADSVTGENLGAAGAAAQPPADAARTERPLDMAAEPAPAADDREVGPGRVQPPLTPPPSGTAGQGATGAGVPRAPDAGATCESGADCESGSCAAEGCASGVERCCRPADCGDGVQNGSESDVDCGGPDPACARCSSGACNENSDCASGSCVAGRCGECSNDARDGNETDVDCGGACGPCATGLACVLDSDCTSGACQDGRCCGGNQADCTRCARRLASTIDCATNGAGAQPTCDAFLQCLSDNAAACEHRLDLSCTGAEAVCDPARFGGNGSAGIALADLILGTAQCTF